MSEHEQNLTIPQLARETQLPVSFWYERSRKGEIPGMFRLGKHIRVDRDSFWAETKGKQVEV